MKRNLLLIVLVGLVFSAAGFAGISREKAPEWQDPEVNYVNKEPAHATLTPYPDAESALKWDDAKSPLVLSLDGK